MRGLHWTRVGLAALLLLGEVVISQLCKSPIVLLDGFHTLFILLNTLSLSITKRLMAPSSDSSPTNQNCGVSYRDLRTHHVGAFISNLVLFSLNVIYLTEICSFMLDPTPEQRPLLLVVMGAVSLLLKMFFLGLHWDQAQLHRSKSELGTESQIEVNNTAPTALAEDEQVEQGGVFSNMGANGLYVESSLQNTALTISNPSTLSISDDTRERYQNGTCAERPNNDTPSNIITTPPDQTENNPAPNSRLSWLLICEHLLTTVLVMVSSLVTVNLGPVCSHSARRCSLLAYMDPVLSLLAVFILIAKATPEVLRYGLLLLQATPPHISVADLGKMIMDVPGVEAMHELHIWQLTESFIAASVHVHCQPGCRDVMLGVTKVFQSVGVSFCSVQPEFACCSPPLAGSQEALSQRCSMACGKACAGSMCCFQLEEQNKPLAAQSGGKTKEEPQTLVITNTVQ